MRILLGKTMQESEQFIPRLHPTFKFPRTLGIWEIQLRDFSRRTSSHYHYAVVVNCFLRPPPIAGRCIPSYRKLDTGERPSWKGKAVPRRIGVSETKMLFRWIRSVSLELAFCSSSTEYFVVYLLACLPPLSPFPPIRIYISAKRDTALISPRLVV